MSPTERSPRPPDGPFALIHDRPFADKQDVIKTTEILIVLFLAQRVQSDMLGFFLTASCKLLGKAELKMKPRGVAEHLEPCSRDAACVLGKKRCSSLCSAKDRLLGFPQRSTAVGWRRI